MNCIKILEIDKSDFLPIKCIFIKPSCIWHHMCLVYFICDNKANKCVFFRIHSDVLDWEFTCKSDHSLHACDFFYNSISRSYIIILSYDVLYLAHRFDYHHLYRLLKYQLALVINVQCMIHIFWLFIKAAPINSFIGGKKLEFSCSLRFRFPNNFWNDLMLIFIR